MRTVSGSVPSRSPLPSVVISEAPDCQYSVALVVWITFGQFPRALQRTDSEDQQFWQGVRASPGRAARDIRSRLKDIDRRLADIESYVTTENRSLAREIEQLR